MIEAIRGARAWLIGREEATKSVLSRLNGLKVLAKYGVGLDNIDCEACTKYGISLGWEAGINSDPVAEHTLGLMLSLCRRISWNAHRLAVGIWHKDGGVSLSGRKVGIVGLGHIGKRVAELLQAFHCSVAYYDILDQSAWAIDRGLKQMDWLSLLAWSEILTFHVPLTPSTYHMLNIDTLKLTRSGVYIVNTSRGPVIDQSALKQFLINGHIAGAGLDVFEEEPLLDKDLFSLNNVVLTPHTAGNSKEAVQAMGSAAIRSLQKVLG